MSEIALPDVSCKSGEMCGHYNLDLVEHSDDGSASAPVSIPHGLCDNILFSEEMFEHSVRDFVGLLGDADEISVDPSRRYLGDGDPHAFNLLTKSVTEAFHEGFRGGIYVEFVQGDICGCRAELDDPRSFGHMGYADVRYLH